MSDARQIGYPYSREEFAKLECGEIVELSGVVYTARDAAHKRMMEQLDAGKDLPFDVAEQIIYYAGPCPAPPGRPIGSCGPTTSGRMDAFTLPLIEAGLIATLGKGPRSDEVIEAMKRHGCVYFAAIGGAAALSSTCITSAETIAYNDLGAEAVRKLEVVSYPCVVAIDSRGVSIFEAGPAAYRR